MKNAGMVYAEQRVKEGHKFEVEIVGPQKLREKDKARMATVKPKD